MASRVNVKFVLILSAALTVVFVAVAGIAFWVLSNNGPRLEREGDQLMAAGEFEIAKKVYGKAYNKDRSSITRLDKYIGAIEAWTPDKPSEYSGAYSRDLLSAFHTHAAILRTDVDSHTRYLEARYQQARWFSMRQTWEVLAQATEDSIGLFESDPAADPSWPRLRKYRGIALVSLMSTNRDPVDTTSGAERDTDIAEEDLAAALTVDPDDTATTIAYSMFFDGKSRQLRQSRRTQDEADQAALRANEIIDDFIASNPTSTEALAYRIVLTSSQAEMAFDESLTDSEIFDARAAIAAEQVGPLDNLLSIAARRPTEDLKPLHLSHLVTLEILITGNAARTELIVDSVLTDSVLKNLPDTPTLIDIRANIARTKNDAQEAIDRYEQILAMEWPPVSLEGVIFLQLREKAAVSIPDVRLALWEAASLEDKAAALTQVKEARLAVGEMVRDTDARLMLLDGKIAYAEQDFIVAQEKLAAFNDLPGVPNAVVLGMLADIYVRSGELGSARDAIQSLIVVQPRSAKHFISLARVEYALKNFDNATTYAEQAVELDPDNSEAGALLVQFQGTTDPTAIAESNPVQAALIGSRRMAMGDGLSAPDVLGAISLLDAAIVALNESSPDFASDREKLLIQQLELTAISGNRDKALEETKRWMQSYPESEAFASLSSRLSTPNTLDGDIQLIDAGSADEHIKLMSKFFAALRRNDEVRAGEFMAQALQLAPDEPVVVETAFSDALRRSDFDAAETFAQKASDENLDRIRGESFTARLQASRGDTAAAITTLVQATQSATAPAGAFRLLGQFQTQLGRYSEAIISLEEALNRSPNDVNAVLAYIRTLVLANRYAEALRVARRYEPVANGSPQYILLWLDLEYRYGNKDIALARREEIQNRVPDNQANSTALIGMYIDLGRIDEAHLLLDQMQSGDADLTVVALTASLRASEGDIVGGQKSYDDYIASRIAEPEGASFQDFAAYATFLINESLIDEAVLVLEQARSVQSPDALEADTALGNLLYDIGKYLEAIEPLTRAVTTGNGNARVRLARALVRVGDFEKAKATIEAAEDPWKDNLELSLAMIDCVHTRGDTKAALILADETVRTFDTSPMPYIERARLKSENPEILDDAIDDLTTALRRDSSHWIALSLRSQIYRRLGKEDEALADLRNAVRANPMLDMERRLLILELIRSGRLGDAKSIANEAISSRPDDLTLLTNIGDIFASQSQWDLAAEFFKVGWQRSPSPEMGMRVVTALLGSQPPSLNDAERILASPSCETESHAGLLVLRASLRMKQGNPIVGRRDASQAVQLGCADLATAARVLENLNAVFETTQETAEFVLTQDLSALPGRAADHFRSIAMLQVPERSDEGLALLRDLASDDSDPVIMPNARRTLIEILLSPDKGEYEEALALMKAALEDRPDHWRYANNIAFVLSKELDRPEEALVFAEKAREIDPSNPSVLDTLGYVYRRLKRYDESEKSLRLAVANAPNPEMRFNTLLHLGQTFVEMNEKENAKLALNEMGSILATLGIDATNNPEIEELRGLIAGLN